MSKMKHNPFITLSKRTGMPKWQSILIRVLAGVLSLLLCAIISCILTKKGFLTFFEQMFLGCFKNQRRIWTMLEEMAILLIIAVAITPAFKMKFWNIGAEGQVLIAGLACTACMHLINSKVPYALLICIMLVASIAAGMLWAFIPAFFKAIWNTNETLFTLMMNYIALQLVAFFINVWVPNGSSVLPDIPYGNLPEIAGQEYLFNVIMVAIVTGLVSLYLIKSKHGYELTVVGESVNTARYIGINVKWVIIRTMLLSGLICGIAGFLLVGGATHNISSSTVNGRGFTAVMVSWLGHFDPLAMIVVAFLVAFIGKGSEQMATYCSIGGAFSKIITGIFFFFIIASEFFVSYKIHFHKPNWFKKKTPRVMNDTPKEVEA